VINLVSENAAIHVSFVKILSTQDANAGPWSTPSWVTLDTVQQAQG